jgi:aldose 1-epimerase
MSVHTFGFGTTSDGRAAHLYVLDNANGMRVGVTDLGACLASLHVPDKDGGLPDVVLGFDSATGYEHNPCDLGAVVGRNANRISAGHFTLDGQDYQLELNDGANNLHSGPDMWFERLWDAATDDGNNSVTFHLSSPDGDQGFPGAVEAYVTYQLTEGNVLSVDYDARPDRRTVLNLTNHAYFNLNGHASGKIDDHLLWIDADEYTASTADLITTGDIMGVAGTAMDFREPRRIGEGFGSTDALIDVIGGYDHNYLLNGSGLRPVARLEGNRSGIVMEVRTDRPAIQLYVSNALDEPRGKDGFAYGTHEGVCLETQYIPDAINKPEWEQPVHDAEHPFVSRTEFAFSVRE